MVNTRRGPLLTGAASLTILIAALAGCSSNGASSSAGNAQRFGYAAARPAQPATHEHARSATTATITTSGARLIDTAQLTVRAANVASAVSLATTLAASAGGYVSSENTSASPGTARPATATLQLKIPVARYPATLGELADGRLGTRVSLAQQAQDVTQEVADVDSQVTSDRAAISQLRTLLSRTASVSDLLTVQNQINTEESQLEAMEAQQSALGHETSFATVTLTVLSPAAAAPRKPAPKQPGLTSGLVHGWHALRISVSWLLAVLGAVAPFAAVIGVVGYLAYRIRRRFARHARPGAADDQPA